MIPGNFWIWDFLCNSANADGFCHASLYLHKRARHIIGDERKGVSLIPPPPSLPTCQATHEHTSHIHVYAHTEHRTYTATLLLSNSSRLCSSGLAAGEQSALRWHLTPTQTPARTRAGLEQASFAGS